MLHDEQRGPARRERSKRLADEPGPLGIELRRRLIEDEMGAVASRGGRRSRRAAPCPPDRRRGSRSARCSMSSVARASSDPDDRLACRQPEVHRAECDLLEDGAGHPGQLGRRVLEADRHARRELVEGPAGHGFAIDPESAAGQGTADRTRGEPRRDQAQRRLAGFVRADDPDDLARRRASGRCHGGRHTRTPRTDNPGPGVRASRNVRSGR